MIITLPESSPRRKRSTSWTLASAIAHTAALALWIGNQGLPEATAAPREKPVYLTPRQPDPRPEPPAATAGAPTTVGLPSLPTVPLLETPRIHVPSIPGAIASPSFDAAAYELRGTFASGADSPIGRIVDAESILPETMVDRRVEPRAGNPIPRYPPALSASGVNGSVTVRFVVDTLGTVERASVRVIFATHPLFEKAVLEALVRMRFVPAQVGTGKVRQLVELPFHFQVAR